MEVPILHHDTSPLQLQRVQYENTRTHLYHAVSILPTQSVGLLWFHLVLGTMQGLFASVQINDGGRASGSQQVYHESELYQNHCPSVLSMVFWTRWRSPGQYTPITDGELRME